MVFSPFHSLAGTKVLRGSWQRVKQRFDHEIRSRKVDRTVRACQTRCLFRIEGVAAAGCVVINIAASSLVVEPLADVSLVSAGAGGKIRGRQWLRRQRLVETQAIS